VIEASRSAPAHEILSEVFAQAIWTRLPHAARTQFLQTACSDQRHAGLVFSAIENGLLPAGMLNIHRRNQWNRVLSEEQRERLESLLGKQVSIDALASFERLKPAAKMQGIPARGKELFLNLCSSCHRLDQTGQALGPDLYGIRNQAKESILLHIADPNREITSGFEGVEWTTSGETFIGLLAFDNGNQIRMQLPSGINLTFQRNQGALRNLDLSLMPEGILNALTHQQVADLLAYLRGE
jgi:putative heme-binding domain-containing protein